MDNSQPIKPIKNIVLCSDGTGNSGGKGNETNVWRLYNGIDIRSSSPEQVAYYDDGVGTQDFKYLKALSGGVGLGFSRNVRQMYKFLLRTYDLNNDNRIYLFGFSRGAFTVRAFAAFALTCGLIKNAPNMSDEELDGKIKELVRDYHKHTRECVEAKKKGTLAPTFNPSMQTAPLPNIDFIGVWDTVSAVGVPFGFGFDWLVRKLFLFYFNDLELHKNVKFARHAMALDEERKAFHPLVWDQREETTTDELLPRIKQAWFAGMHSNVGGGYPKQGMSYEALDWMLDELKQLQYPRDEALRLEVGFAYEAHQKADVFDLMYNSRSGAGAYYRPKQRHVGEFCRSAGLPSVNVHTSVFRRIADKGRAYHPGSLPTNMPLTSVPTASEFATTANDMQTDRAQQASQASKFIRMRNATHLALVLVTLHFVMAIIDQMVSNGFVFLGGLVAAFGGLYLTERLAQQYVHWRIPIYVTGLAAIVGTIWTTVSLNPYPTYQYLVIPALLLVIAARIAYRHFRTPQPTFALPPDNAQNSASSTPPKSHYRRVESAYLGIISCLMTITLYADVWSGRALSTIECTLRDGLNLVLTPLLSPAPQFVITAVTAAINQYPSWVMAALTSILVCFYLMRKFKSDTTKQYEASWDAVRKAVDVNN